MNQEQLAAVIGLIACRIKGVFDMRDGVIADAWIGDPADRVQLGLFPSGIVRVELMEDMHHLVVQAIKEAAVQERDVVKQPDRFLPGDGEQIAAIPA